MNIKKNLIFFLPNFVKGGASSAILRLCKHTDKNKYNLFIISLNKNELKNELSKYCSEIFEINSKSVLLSSLRLIKIVKYIKNKYNSYSIFISNIHYANIISGLFLKKNKKFKLIFFERTNFSELNFYYSIKDFFRKIVIKLLLKKVYSRADRLISNSKQNSYEFSKICKRKFYTVYSPIEKVFKFKKRKIFKNKINIVFVGRLSIEKGCETIIKALKKLDNKNIYLDIFGDGPLEYSLKSLVKSYNLQKNIRFNGFQNISKNKLKKFHLLISASHFEGLPNAIAEGINYNLPVIAPNINGGTRELLLNGKGGYLYKPNDYCDLSNKINIYLRNPKDLILKSKIAKNNLSKYHIKNVIKQFEWNLNNL